MLAGRRVALGGGVSAQGHRIRLPEQRWDRIAIGAISAGAVLRIVWILVVHPPVDYVFSDMGDYVRAAQRLVSDAPLAPYDAFFPPGTQILLAIPLKLFGAGSGLWVAAGLWCALSIAVVYMAWRLTRELLGPAAAGLTAVLCAVWPLFITYGGYFTSETPSTAFLVAALWVGVMAARRAGQAATILVLLSGVLAGVAVAVRPQLLMNMLIMGAVVFFASGKRIVPLACFAAGLLAVVGLVIVHNSIATHQLAGLARNGGVNFWFGHCEARHVVTLNSAGKMTGEFTFNVPFFIGRGGQYVFKGHEMSDEGFFLELGWKCIEQDKLKHVLRLGRNIIDMTATTAPWPQNLVGGWLGDVVQAANVLYSILLPWIVIESLFLIARRRKDGKPPVEAFLLLNLMCVVVVAIVLFGEPRVRSVYDVFGFALLAALIADRFHLGRSDRPNEAVTAL